MVRLGGVDAAWFTHVVGVGTDCDRLGHEVVQKKGWSMYTRLAVILVVWTTFSEAAPAQLVTESIDLQAGWNAVWLNLQPEPNTVDEILAAQSPPLDYQAIWTLVEKGAATAVNDGDATGRWLFHDRDVPPNISTLRVLHGHRGYLIHMRSAGQLHLAGRPVIRSHQFSSRTANLFGALTDPTSGILSFEQFFSHPKAIGKVRAGGTPVKHDVFAMSANSLVRKNLTDAILPNTAYWVNVVQDFEYAGPLDLTSTSNGLSFGRTTALRTLSIGVPFSASARTVTLEALPCAALAANGACSAGAGAVDWLEFRDSGPLELPTWQPLAAGAVVQVPPGLTQVEVQLRARRAELATSARNRGGGTSPVDFPLVIDVKDDVGTRAVLAANVSIEPVFGRWIGRATLTRVSAHPAIQPLPLDQAEAPQLEMTLLLELPDPTAAQGGASPQLLDSMTVDTFRDGRPLARRFTTVLFDRPVVLTEDAGDPLDPLGASGTLHGTLPITPEDPLNPYRHRYHPEHRKGYDITRDITIKIESQQDRLTEELAGLDGTFGSQRLRGQYTEVITGISAQPITVQGTFQLDRVPGSSNTAAGNP